MEHLTVVEAAEALQLSVPTIKRYIYEGKLKSIKLPGGQHRIARQELDRLLGGAGLSPVATEPEPEAAPTERLAVLERWVTELQAEMERLSASVEVLSRYCARFTQQPPEIANDQSGDQSDGPRHRVLILGPGCKRCDALVAVAQRLLQAGGHADIPVERVRDLDDIAAFGPIVTPALVVDDQVVVTGRVPTEAALREALRRALG